jgi:hypothetical protein
MAQLLLTMLAYSTLVYCVIVLLQARILQMCMFSECAALYNCFQQQPRPLLVARPTHSVSQEYGCSSAYVYGQRMVNTWSTHDQTFAVVAGGHLAKDAAVPQRGASAGLL